MGEVVIACIQFNSSELLTTVASSQVVLVTQLLR